MFVNYPRKKVWKYKTMKMLLFFICEAPPIMSTSFWPFLAIFPLFHLTNLLYLQKREIHNLPETRFWLLLVNNSLCSIPPSWALSYIIIIAVDSRGKTPCGLSMLMHLAGSSKRHWRILALSLVLGSTLRAMTSSGRWVIGQMKSCLRKLKMKLSDEFVDFK